MVLGHQLLLVLSHLFQRHLLGKARVELQRRNVAELFTLTALAFNSAIVFRHLLNVIRLVCTSGSKFLNLWDLRECVFQVLFKKTVVLI